MTPKAAAADAKPVAVVEPVRVLPKLHTGEIVPELETQAIVGTVKSYVRTASTETFAIEVGENGQWDDASWVVFEGTPFPGPFSFVERSGTQPEGKRRVWLRRAIQKDTKPLTRIDVTVLTAHPWGNSAAKKYRLVVPEIGKLRSDPKQTAEYEKALIERVPGTPVASLLSAAATSSGGSVSELDWSELMRVMTGYTSVDSALRARDGLRVTSDPKLSTVPMTELKAPVVPPHPWEKMLAALPAAPKVSEPLAGFVPADFYFVRASNFDALQAVLDEVDAWATPAAHLSEANSRRLDLVARYRTQLGLSPSELTRILGPALIKDLALVGSDPFLRQGSDVSLVIRPKDPVALNNALQAKLRVDFPGGVSQTSFTLGGFDVVQRTTTDGALRQFVVQIPAQGPREALTVVSNSRGALSRILDVVQGKQPALSKEHDFEYMLQRDASVAGDVLAYAGDRFVAAAVSPVQRVLDARRQLALGELLRPGLSAMLFAWLEGREPSSIAELEKSPWIKRKLLAHSNKEPIQFELGKAPHSSWGSPGAMIPIAELPVPTHVSPEERTAYEQFARSYEFAWNERLDPIAGRFSVARNGNKRTLQAHVRVLPISRVAEYQKAWALSGSGQARTTAPFAGAFMTFGVGEDAELRREFSSESRSLFGRSMTLDWLGSWVSIGVADEPRIPEIVQSLGEAPELPREREGSFDKAIIDLPVFAVVDIKNAGMAAIAITALRRIAEGAASDLLRWEPTAKYRDTSIVKVSFSEVTLYYALTKKRFYVSLVEPLLHGLIDADLDGKPMATAVAGTGASLRNRGRDASESPPVAVNAGTPAVGGGGQLVIDFNARSPSALLQAVSWAIEKELRSRVRSDAWDAEMYLRGLPGRSADEQQSVLRNYQGSRILTPEGSPFRLTLDGVEDPIRGTTFHPKFPDVPAPGSELKAVLDALGSSHAALAFDIEPGSLQEPSLRAEFTVTREVHAE